MSTLLPTGQNHSLKEDIRAYWSKRAETFDLSSGHRIRDGIEAQAWQALFREGLGDLAGKRVLDLACGTGEISRMLLAMGAEVTGVDFAEPMLMRAKAKHQGRAFTGHLSDVETLMLEPDASYEAIVTRHLVWTLTDPAAAFATWFRVLKPGGRLLIVDGNWVRVGRLGRAMKALAQRLSRKDGAHGDGVDLTEHNRLLAGVHYRDGLDAATLIHDLSAYGFETPRQHAVQRLYLWGMRQEPLADWLRLNSAQRFAVSVRKPATLRT
jgi:ubiquinone/menaquinone biosynthesis C-methylase UbiE